MLEMHINTHIYNKVNVCVCSENYADANINGQHNILLEIIMAMLK